MKTLAKKRFSSTFGLKVFLAGVVSLFFPHFSGWNEIVFPQFALIGLISYLLWIVLFAISFGSSLLNAIALFFTSAPQKTKVISACLSVGLLVLFLSIYPNIMTEQHLGVDQRISFFAVGGQTRILWAGGSEAVKNDALILLKQHSGDEGSVSSDTWPSSFKRLGAVDVRIDNKTQSVIIHIPEALMSEPDQFGYLITNEKEVSPNALKHGDHNRLWKLADEIYFFETWE